MTNHPQIIVLTPSEGILMESRKDTLHPIGILDHKTITDHMLSLGEIEINTDILPPNTILYKKKSNTIIIVTELKPACRTIKFETNGRVSTKKLSFPFMYFINHVSVNKNSFILNKSYLLCANDRIRSTNDKVYRMFLNNIGRNSAICWGDAYTEDHQNLSDLIDNVITSFFSSAFNNDYSHVLRRTMGEINSYDNWEKVTKNLGDNVSAHYDYWSQYNFKCKQSLRDFI